MPGFIEMLQTIYRNAMYPLEIFNLKVVGIDLQKERNKGWLSMI